MPKALVTGGAGFIGSHLVEFLLERDWDVLVLDDLSTGTMDNLSRSHPRLTFEGRSILDAIPGHGGRIFLSTILDQMVHGVDYVFHLASIVGVKRVLQYPLDTLEDNIQSTSALLHAAAKYKKPTIITSSSEVYGDALQYDLAAEALSETMSLMVPAPTHQRYGYAAAKLVEEYMALAHHQSNGLPVVVTRLFNVIGPRQSSTYGSVVPTFIGQALAGEPITVYGTGHQRRTFTWVGHVVQALADLVQEPRAWGQVVNIGSDQNCSVLSLAFMIKRLTGSSSQITHISPRQAYGATFQDITDRVPDLQKIQSLISYLPEMGLDQMLKAIIEHRTLTIHLG